LRVEGAEAPRVGLEVVEEQHLVEPERRAQGACVHRPGEVRHLYATVAHRPRDPEGRGVRSRRMHREKGAEHLLERRVRGTRVDLEGLGRAHVAVEERKPRVRGADVAREDQLWITSSAWPPNSLRIAESSLSANWASPREEKRSKSALDRTGTGTP